MSPGRVVVLNGTSSSGKTTLARALQDRLLPDVWLVVGIDTFITALPWRLFGTDEGHTIHADGSIDVGPAFSVGQARWRHAVAALASAGANLILDEVFLRGSDEQDEWRAVLDGLVVTWVGVHCDIDVAEAREGARGDRAIGMARAQAAAVHAGVSYDVEVDTTATPPDLLASELAAQVQVG